MYYEWLRQNGSQAVEGSGKQSSHRDGQGDPL
jgi:hypothetical protein